MSTNPWEQADPRCEVCGLDPSDCICPECSVCGATGDPACYDKHGLKHGKQNVVGAVVADLSNLEREEFNLLIEIERNEGFHKVRSLRARLGHVRKAVISHHEWLYKHVWSKQQV